MLKQKSKINVRNSTLDVRKSGIKQENKEQSKKSFIPKIKINIETYNPVKRGFRSIGQIKNWLIMRFYSEEAMLINMELRNGMFTSFMIRTKDTSFEYAGGTYLIDNELKYYHLDAGLYALDYHQDFALPIRKTIPLNEISKAVSASGVSDVEVSTNPIVLRKFIESKLAEGIMKSQQIDEYLRQMKMLIIITMVASVAMVLLFIAKTGMLQGIRIPGIN